MKQKTRYNVRLAGRKGVKVRRGGMEDLPSVYDMYAATSVRDGFVIRGQDYYKAAWGNFLQAKMADLLIAEVDEEPVAGLFLYYFARKAWYLYGMSHTLHREKMPSSLLQWEAIKCAKDKGCTVYDLWGAPDVFDSSDPMWGVYRFKEGLGGQVVRHIGAWDLPIRPLYYRLYAQFMPKILNVLRMRGKSITRQDFAA
jgi:lipid II:glycine glycyltransferase (peptidoglycan interpeptide bridge formation enzyme)